jgi:hypothetical protein
MGRNVDLCDMLGAPEELACRKCGRLSRTGFNDYDIDGVWTIDPGNGRWQTAEANDGPVGADDLVGPPG